MAIYRGYDLDGNDPFGGSYRSKTNKRSWDESTTRERRGIIDQATPPVRREEVEATSGGMRELKDLIASNASSVQVLSTEAQAAFQQMNTNNQQMNSKINTLADVASTHEHRLNGHDHDILQSAKKINRLEKKTKKIEKESAKKTKLLNKMEKRVKKIEINMRDDARRNLSFCGERDVLSPNEKENTRPRANARVRDVLSPNEKENARPCGNTTPVSGDRIRLKKLIADQAVKKGLEIKMNARKKRARIE